ncbi:MAG: flagellar motor switch protein FliN/FliY [Paracoccaceae bacterium]|jgi:flagellar motor switch protein FliN/FliY
MPGTMNPEEAAALADAARRGGADGGTPRVSVVTPRDFTEPRTLSADRIARIRKTLSARLQVIANALAGPLRGHPSLSLGEVSEVNAQGLFDGFVRPFLVQGFQCSAGLGWIIWETDAARIACDTVLSGPPTETELEERASAREPMLTRTERRVVGNLLDELVQRVSTEFGLEVEPGTVWQEPEELTTMEDLGPDADARRLFIHLGFEPESGHPSDIRIYLPGIAAPVDEEPVGHLERAPAHLAGMELELSIHIGGTDVPLAELLNIEVGDVIPLDARIGDLADVEIEETVCARGRIGSKNGLLALVIQEICDVPKSGNGHPEPSATSGH